MACSINIQCFLMACPRKFTKMMKSPLSHLRLLNHIIIGYIDDFYLQGSTYERCIINVIDSIKLLDELGLVVHPEKSVLKTRFDNKIYFTQLSFTGHLG